MARHHLVRRQEGPARDETVLHAWEGQLGETIDLLTVEVERRNPTRVVFDSLSELRLLAQDPLRYRRQIPVLKQFFTGRHCTALPLDDLAADAGQADLQLQSLCYGIVTLKRRTLDYGPARRRLEVAKMRSASYREGWHDYAVRTGRLEVYPRLAATPVVLDVSPGSARERLSSGGTTLDALLGGGPLRDGGDRPGPACRRGTDRPAAGPWSIPTAGEPGGAGRRLHLTWSEMDGPRVAPPSRRSFGSRLIERGLAREFGRTARIEFAPEGVRCAMDLSLADDPAVAPSG